MIDEFDLSTADVAEVPAPRTVRVLADFHHHALAESLAILFEDRFGWELYYPQGMQWFDEGVWQFEKQFHGDAVARQYLLGMWDTAVDLGDGIVYRHDPRHPGRVQMGVTYDRARDMEWDVIVSTLPPNDLGFAALAREKGAAFIIQVGNNHQESLWHLADVILSSSTLPEAGFVSPDTWAKPLVWQGKPTVIYHQEFSLHHFTADTMTAEPRTVASFVNCFPEGPSYPDFLTFARAHLDLAGFRVYGAPGRPSWWTGEGDYHDEFTAPNVQAVTDVAMAMRKARVGWHSKHWSDGFGHTIHNWFAVGRPVLGYARYYKDKLAGPLWVEGETSFDIEGKSQDEIAAIIHRLIDDDAYWTKVCEQSAHHFRDMVSYEAEAAAIRTVIEGARHG